VSLPATIDPTGEEDVTDALNAFFATVPPDTTVALPPDARLRVEGVVEIADADGLTVDGNGATLFAETDGREAVPPRGGFRAHWPRRREHLELRRGSGIRVQDLTVRGANRRGGATAAAYVPELEGQAGIAVVGTRGVVLDDVTISETYGDLVYVNGGATDVTVTRSRLRRSGRQGVAVVNGSGITVRDNEISGIGRSVLDLEPPGRGLARDVHFVGNRVGEYRNFLLAAVGGGPGVEAIELRGNVIDGARGLSVVAGIDRVTRRDLRIVDNRGTTEAAPLRGYGTGALLQLTNLHDVEIRGNRQPLAGGVAITLDRVCRAAVDANSFPGAATPTRTLGPCGPATSPPVRPDRRLPAPAPMAPAPPAAPVPPTMDDGDDGPGWGVALLAAGAGLVVGLGAGTAAGLWLTRRRGAAQTSPEPRSQST
jgi:hypothetical protein